MKKQKILYCSFLLFFLCSCSNTEVSPVYEETVSVSETTEVKNDSVPSDFTVESTGKRNNTPVCLVPVASGSIVFSNELASIDASNATEGYIMAKYTGTNSKVKFQIQGSDEVVYTYDLGASHYEAFPLSSGSGKYKMAVYENVEGTTYSCALAANIDVTITNKFGPNLYPNQYCNFSKDSKVVSKAVDLTSDCADDLEAITNIYDYVVENISYDHDKASNVESGYISDVDEILYSGKGICLDYAAVMTSMLRSQNIPTRLEVGYAGTAYHAWISTYINEVGWVNGIIQFDGESWSLMDPTFAASSSTEALKSFIGDGSNYKTKYVY